MKIILMYPPSHSIIQDYTKHILPLGIYVLGSVLKQNGYDVTLCDTVMLGEYYQDNWDPEINQILKGADIVGISSNSFNWAASKELISIIKTNGQHRLVVCGGIHPSHFDEHILRHTRADLVVRGDGEEALFQIVRAHEAGKPFNRIPGVSFLDNGQLVRVPIVVKPELPDIDIQFFDHIPQGVYKAMPVETSRGCRFHCTFCSLYFCRQWRAFKAERVIDKIQTALEYLNKVNTNRINFVDDYFSADYDRSRQILQWIDHSDHDFSVTFEVRCNDFLKHKELVHVLPRAKIGEIHMGIECGYDDGLKRVKKGFKLSDIEESLAILQRHNFTSRLAVSFLVGFPWETLENCLSTIEYAKYIKEKYNVRYAGIVWWYPLVSRLWQSFPDFGIEIDAHTFDDANWIVSKKVLYDAHAGLSRNDINIIDMHVAYPIRLITKDNAIVDFEL